MQQLGQARSLQLPTWMVTPWSSVNDLFSAIRGTGANGCFSGFFASWPPRSGTGAATALMRHTRAACLYDGQKQALRQQQLGHKSACQKVSFSLVVADSVATASCRRLLPAVPLHHWGMPLLQKHSCVWAWSRSPGICSFHQTKASHVCVSSRLHSLMVAPCLLDAWVNCTHLLCWLAVHQLHHAFVFSSLDAVLNER
jgi:hypothetical protein